MLVLKRRVGQSVFVGEDVEVVFLSLKLDEIKLGFRAPNNIPIIREELLFNHLNYSKYKSFMDSFRSKE